MAFQHDICRRPLPRREAFRYYADAAILIAVDDFFHFTCRARHTADRHFEGFSFRHLRKFRDEDTGDILIFSYI